jgi:hypothetical protein
MVGIICFYTTINIKIHFITSFTNHLIFLLLVNSNVKIVYKITIHEFYLEEINYMVR